MRHMTLLVLAPALLALTACHSNAGYLSTDPKLTYGPGVVEFPDPARVYLAHYRRIAMATAEGEVAASTLDHGSPIVTYTPPVDVSRGRVVTARMNPSPAMRTGTVVATAPQLRAPQLRAANVDVVRGGELRGDALVLDTPVAPTTADIRIHGDRLPARMLPSGSVSVTAPPKGAPLPPPTGDRPFRETELVVTPGGVYTR